MPAIDCEDKNNWCPAYVRIYGDRFCNDDWFISDDGRYGCKKSCGQTSCVSCKDDDFWCPTYVKIYGDRVCQDDWFISNTGRYGCKKSCNLC